MILTKEVEMGISSKSAKYYKALGYDIPMKKPANPYLKDKDLVYDYSKTIMVKVEDLPKGSEKYIDVLCDMCHEKVFSIQYDRYNKCIEQTRSCVCQDCVKQKRKDAIYAKYGVFNLFELDEIQEKILQTLLDRYGVENPGQMKDHQEKVKQTCLDKYGVENFAQLDSVKEKRIQTNLERYGVEHALQSDEIKSKIVATCLEKYGDTTPSRSLAVREKARQTNLQKLGVEYPTQSPIVKEKQKQTFLKRYNAEWLSQISHIRAKAMNTLYKNGSVACSTQQLYIYNLYNQYDTNIALNYPIGASLFADIYFPEELLIVEYDGGGHNLAVKLGELTQEEFEQKEIVRNKILKKEGCKVVKIISYYDKLPSDIALLQILENARIYFIEHPEHSWIEFNIDYSTIRNAIHKDGIFFDYGELRRVATATMSQITIDDVGQVENDTCSVL